jgi:hypothetical protein
LLFVIPDDLKTSITKIFIAIDALAHAPGLRCTLLLKILPVRNTLAYSVSHSVSHEEKLLSNVVTTGLTIAAAG